jgi:hypothetical protein
MIFRRHWCPFQNNLSIDLELGYKIELGDFGQQNLGPNGTFTLKWVPFALGGKNLD